MHQRGESTDQKSRCPHTTLRFEEAPLMRLSVGTLRQVVKRDLSIAFVPQQLTSYGGLELLRRYVRRLALPRRLQAACAALGGDYGGARLALLSCPSPEPHPTRLRTAPSGRSEDQWGLTVTAAGDSASARRLREADGT